MLTSVPGMRRLSTTLEVEVVTVGTNFRGRVEESFKVDRREEDCSCVTVASLAQLYPLESASRMKPDNSFLESVEMRCL